MTTPVSSPTGTSSTSGTQSASQQLAGNFDTFLTLLTTQLQNQDPLSPMDSNQFTQQLVEFSSVEQQINTNDNLKSLISLTQNSNASNAVGYLGKNIGIVGGQGLLSDGSADWSYALGAASTSTTLTITNSDGKVVYSTTGETASGKHDFTWDGKDNAGNELPDGGYVLSVNAQAEDGSDIDVGIASHGVVGEVNYTGDEPLLMVGSMAVPLSQVATIGTP